MVLYRLQIPTREDWQKTRNAVKVPKGVAKVSVGEGISRIRKAWQIESAAQAEKELKKFISELGIYLDQTKDKYPKITAPVEKIKKDAAFDLKVIKDVNTARAEYMLRYKDVAKALDPARANPNAANVKALASALERLLGVLATYSRIDDSYDQLRRKANSLMSQCKPSVFNAQMADDVQGLLKVLPH